MKKSFRILTAFMMLAVMVLQPTSYLQFGTTKVETVEAATSVGSCLVANGTPSNASCNANDVSISSPSVTIINGCDGTSGDTATFDLYSTISVNAQNRYDIGVWLSNNGQSPLNGSSCTAANLTGSNGSCGDLEQGTYNNRYIGRFTVQCIDTDNNGFLNVPVVTTWGTQNNPSCNTPQETAPSNGAKCKISNNLSIPVPVPAQSCTKTSNANACGATNTTTGTIVNNVCNATTPTVPANPANYGQACTKTSAANSCGATSTTTGTIGCDGSCNAPTPVVPANPSYYGNACTKTSNANSCGATSVTTGTLTCQNTCNAATPVTPANPVNFGQACSVTSDANACGATTTATGTYTCGGTCSAQKPAAPANPEYYGQACSKTSNANSCGMTNTTNGIYACDHSCDATEPTVPANPEYYGQACSLTSSGNACGATNTTTGTLTCQNTCNAVIPEVPANPEHYGEVCTSTANACGEVSTGTISCNSTCTAEVPYAADINENQVFDCLEADMAITKSVDLSTTLIGSILTYNIGYVNLSNYLASGVVITDTLPAGTTFVSSSITPTSNISGVLTWDLNSLIGGASGFIQLVVDTDNATAGDVTNTATITSANDYNNENNTASAITTLNTPPPTPFVDVQISKSVNTEYASVGSQLTYTLNYSNQGNATAENIVISDTIPAGTTLVNTSVTPSSNNNGALTWEISSLAAGATGSIEITVGTDGMSEGKVTNTATVNVMCVTNDVTDKFEEEVTESQQQENNFQQESNENENENNENNKNTCGEGQHMNENNVCVDNQNNDDNNDENNETCKEGKHRNDKGHCVSDNSDDNSDNGTGNDNNTCDEGQHLNENNVCVDNENNDDNGTGDNENTCDEGQHLNEDDVCVNDNTGGGGHIVLCDMNTENNTSSASTSLFVPATVDLSINKTANVESVTVGGQITYTISYVNNGNTTANGVTITDVLPAGVQFVSSTPTTNNSGSLSWYFEAIGAGETGSISVVVTAIATGSITNIASIDSRCYKNTDRDIIVEVDPSDLPPTPILVKQIVCDDNTENNDTSATVFVQPQSTTQGGGGGSFGGGFVPPSVGLLDTGVPGLLDTGAPQDNGAKLTRGETAKMLTEYYKKVLKLSITRKDSCNPKNYSDYSKMSKSTRENIWDACSLGLMGWKNDRKTLLKAFRADDYITKGEFAAVLSRMLYNTDGKDNSQFRYAGHIFLLKHYKVINGTIKANDFETRGNVEKLLKTKTK